MLSRYGSSEEAVQLTDWVGTWQKPCPAERRIREIAGELMQVAAQRALKKAPVLEVEDGPYKVLDRFQYEETDDQERAGRRAA